MNRSQSIINSFSEDFNPRGTYTCIEFTPESCEMLLNYYSRFSIPNLYTANKLHCTLIYSPDSEYIQIPPKLTGSAIELYEPKIELFGKNKDVVVISFKSNLLQQRHDELSRSYNLDHTFEEYKPHITLSEQAPGFDINSVVPIPMLLSIQQEKTEPIH